MKKSKVILAIALAVLLVAICVCAPTFSWFTRPKSHNKGSQMLLQENNSYSAYNGKGVTFSTMESASGVVETNNDTYTTNCNADNACSASASSPLENGERKYFCTTITNSSGKEQNVSLYASRLSIPIANNGSLAIGVNSPTRSYRNYTELTKQPYHVTRNYDMRIYFQTGGIAGWNDGPPIYISYHTPYHENEYEGHLMTWIASDGYGTWMADIPFDAHDVFFSVEGWEQKSDDPPDESLRSVQIGDLSHSSIGQSQTQSKIFKIKGDTSNDGYREFDGYFNTEGASVLYYCDSVQIKTGETFNVGQYLQRNPQTSVEYYTADTSLFTVNSSGVITANSNNIEGTGTLRTRVRSNASWHGDKDYYDVYTTVQINAQPDYVFNDVPIVKNLKIPGTDDQSTAADDRIVKVYWYIINNSALQRDLRYSIDYLYLGM